ncbi:MAG: peptide ABC transporter substrate-binding protein [Gammaproteobacteria bacterium]|nr:peptide ABC transporter substrate-binding protein [Gammaproteobacteria bacterium]NNM13425.1 peptide ABC transporter substrate-binding protein [Gammaproteobacteria bacterium]
MNKSVVKFSLSRFFSIVLIASLVACGGQNDSSEQSTNSSANQQQSAAANKKIGREYFLELQEGQELAEEQVLHKGNGAEVQTLDPHKAEGVPSSNVLRDLYEGLTSEAPTGEVIPGAAESWTLSDDGLVYTFKIRENAKWSNGDPLTAADFEYGIKRSIDPATLSKYAYILAPIKNAEAISSGNEVVANLGVKAIDEVTLEIQLKAPTPYFLGLLNHSSTYPVHKASVEEYGDQFSRPGKMVSNGAYYLVDWVPQSHMILDRNTHYWDNADTIINRVYYYPIEDQSTGLKRYRANELDYTYELPYKQLTWIKENIPDELVIAPYLGVYYFGFNLTQPPFKDNFELRKALTLAIDREVITERVTGAGEIPAYNFVPPVNNYTGQKPDWANWTQAERLAEAKKLYAAAGYTKDSPLTISIHYNTHENHKTISTAVAAMWKQSLGVNVELLNQEWKVFLETRKQKKETQVFRAGWIGDYNDPYTFSELMLSNSGLNDSAYYRDEYDALLAKASVESDLGKRRLLLEEAERMMMSELPIMPIYHYVTKRVVKKHVGGFHPNIMDHHFTKDMFIVKH